MTVTTPTTSDDPHGGRPTRAATQAPELRRLGRINRRLVLLLGASIVAIAVALSLLLVLDRAPSVSAADAASTARLNGAAGQYDAIRQTRSDQAWTARLEAAAAHDEAIRLSRSNQAWAARLEGAAAQYEAMRLSRSNQAWTARLTQQAERDRD